MKLFCSMKGSPTERWSMVLDVNLSSACDPELMFQNDLWPDGFLLWGYFCKGQTSSWRMPHNCLENFWQWVLEIPPGWISALWFELCIQAIAPTLNSVQTLVVLLGHSLKPFKKGTRKTAILIFRKYQLWNFSSPWASGGSMKHCRKSWLRIFQTGGP